MKKSAVFIGLIGLAGCISYTVEKNSRGMASVSDDRAKVIRHHVRAMPRSDAKTKKPDDISDAISPQELITHFRVDALHDQGLTGKGQHIAIINYDKVTPNMQTSINQFWTLINAHPTVNFIGEGSEDDDAPSELEIDIEMAGLIAPNAVIDVYSFDDDVPDDQAIATVLNSGDKIFSSSWSPCEKQVLDSVKEVTDQNLALAVGNRISVLYASGDYGLSCNSDVKGAKDGTATRSWPTTNPNVTAVGAVSFVPTPDAAFTEVGWRFAGGGPSLDYTMPSYQQGFLPSVYKRSGVYMRGIPDISMLGGDPKIKVLSMGKDDTAPTWYAKRGTSYAAPELGGLLALVNEGRANLGKKPIGFLNPIMYGMGPEERARAIRDVVASDSKGRKEHPGWTSLTGLGTPIGDQFVLDLIQQP